MDGKALDFWALPSVAHPEPGNQNGPPPAPGMVRPMPPEVVQATPLRGSHSTNILAPGSRVTGYQL